MNSVIRHIEFLLSASPCVIIPGMGALLAHDVPAYITEDGTLMPPRRRYTFNPALVQSDGMLEQSIARALSVPFERARAIVAAAVDNMHAEIAAGNSVSLGKVGFLKLCDDGICFESYKADTLTPVADWLTPVAADTFEQINTVAASVAAKASPRRWRKIVRGVATAAAAVAIAIVASTPVTINNAAEASAALPSISAPKAAYVPNHKAPMLDLQLMSPVVADTAARAMYRDSLLAAKTSVEQAPVVKPKALTISDAHHYCIVVASVSTIDEAYDEIARRKRVSGGEYGVLASDTHVRVYAATAATSAEANAIAKSVAQRYPGAWVCYK